MSKDFLLFKMLRNFLAVMLFVFISGGLLSKSFAAPFVADFSPLKKYPKQYAIYKKYEGKKVLKMDNSRELEKAFAEVLEQEKMWIDGHWKYGEIVTGLASGLFNNEEEIKESRMFWTKMKDMQESCLKIEPEQPMCKMYLAFAIGSIGTIDGVFESLKHADVFEKLMLEVIESKIEYRLPSGYSPQGMVHHALGIFYRLIPDSFWIKLFFGVRGNKQKSVDFHKVAVKADGDQYPCYNLMLGVARVCLADGDKKSEEFEKGMELLFATSEAKGAAEYEGVCIRHSKLIYNDPSLACGYSLPKQQKKEAEMISETKSKK